MLKVLQLQLSIPPLLGLTETITFMSCSFALTSSAVPTVRALPRLSASLLQVNFRIRTGNLVHCFTFLSISGLSVNFRGRPFTYLSPFEMIFLSTCKTRLCDPRALVSFTVLGHVLHGTVLHLQPAYPLLRLPDLLHGLVPSHCLIII